MIHVNSGETVNDLFVKEDEMYVHSTGVANGTIVDKDGWVYVSKGGILNNTYINKDGEVDLLNGGSANNTQIMTDGALYASTNAVAFGTVVEGGTLVIESKGIASDTTVNGPGQMYVFSGGKTKGTTTVNDGGFLTLEWESIHSSAIIHGGKLTVLGGPADGDMAFLQNFTVDSGGSLTVSGSALVSSGTITDGWAKVTSDGTLEKVTLNAATVEVKNGALLSNADMKTGTLVNIASGGVIRKLAVSKGAVLTGVLRDVSELHFDGGTLDLNISGIAPGGEFLIGDTAYSAYISGSSYNCTLTVDSSAQTAGVYELIEDATGFDKTITVKDTLGTTLGTLMLGGDPLVYGPLSYTLSIDTTGLLSVTVGAGNIITGDVTDEFKDITAGWTALNVNVNTNGVLQIFEGGVASNTTINNGGEVNVSNGGVASDTDVNSNGYAFIDEGGSASGVTVASDGTFNVAGAAENVKVLAGGVLYHSSGASIKDLDADGGAYLELTLGEKTYAAGKSAGTAFELKETADGFSVFDQLTVTKGGTAVNTVVNKDKWLHVESTGAANNTTVNEDGNMYVSSGGTAKVTNVSGFFEVGEDGVADIVHVGNLGGLFVSAGGIATNIIVDEGGYADVFEGFIGNVTVNKDGAAWVSEGGMLSGAAVADGGLIGVYWDGVLSDFTVSAGGKLWAYGKGKLTGKMTFETGAAVETDDAANILDFDLTQTTAGADALVNGLSLVIGDPNFIYTLTVDGTEAAGDYKLAEGAAGFDETITVVNTLGETLGTLTVADVTTTIGGRDYTLTLTTGGSLGVNIDGGGGGVDLTGDLTTTFELAAGMVGSSVNILDGGSLEVLNGGFASKTTVNSNGDFVVSGGGSADVVTVNFGGDLFVRNGGVATLVMENGGYASVNDGATVTFVPNSFNGYVYDKTDDWATLHSGTTGTDLTAGNAARILVFSSGLAKNTTVNTGGALVVSTGGKADGMNLKGGTLFVSDGGRITGKMTFETGATVTADAGATLDFDLTQTTPGADALVNDLSFAISQPFAYTITVDGTEAAGDYKLAEGAAGFDQTIMVVNTLGETLGTLTVAGGKTTIGGRDYTLTLGGTGSLGLTIADGGVDLTGDLSTTFDLTAGMVGSSVNILLGGVLDVLNGGFTSQTTVNSGGDLYVYGGGSADATTVNPGGKLTVYDYGSATNVTENGGCVYVYDSVVVTFVAHEFTGVELKDFNSATVHSGTTATDTTLVNGGQLYVYDGGIARNTKANAESYLAVSSGGLATGTTVIDIANLFVYDSGMASDTTVKKDGNLHIQEGGAAEGITVEAVGFLYVYDGGKVTGKMTFEAGSYATFYDGAIVDFDLTQTTAGADALVNDLSFVGTAAVNYTLTVDGTEAAGDYKLAEGADGFGKTITVVNTSGVELGTLTVAGGKTTIGGRDYTLTLGGTGSLGLTIADGGGADTTKPEVKNVAADITAPTNGNVTVTADFTDNVAVKYKYYKLSPESLWLDYPDGGVVMTENGTVYFEAVDTSDNVSEVVTFSVTNIDKEPPTITAITPSTTEPAASVTVTASFDDDVSLAFQQFRIGSGAWQDYTTGVTVTENGIIYFKAVDAAGNETNASYEVTNIQTLEPDTTKPEVVNVAADVTAPTNGNVTVTAEFTDNVEVAYKYFTLSLYDMWQDYPDGGVVVTENNTTVYFEAVDTSGNTSDVVTYTVTNIDKEAPTITGITPSTTAPAAYVTVTATFSDDVALATQQYKIGAGAWQDYTTGVLVTENALVTFKAVDTAGNETTETYDVTNISSGGGTVVTGDVTDETKDVNTGMVASDVNVNVNGILNVFTGGVASKTTVNTEGSLVVSGGSAVQTSVNAGGEIFVSAGGKADNTTVTGGVMRVYDGGSATNTTLQDNGTIIIFVGGVASDTIAETDGWIRVSSGGVAEDVTVKNGGKLILHEGGKITGKMTFENGAIASAEENSIVDFNIYSLSPANEPLLNNLSLLSGTPKYTLTINSAQSFGMYNLAGGAAAFDQTITVQSILGAEVGSLTVGGGAMKIGDVYYTLNLTGSSLTVTVSSGGETDTTPPVVSNVAASITTPTNGDVTVTASFTDNVAVASSLYRIGGGDWQNYTGGVTLAENATVYFKAVDTSGNESEVVSITVSNIDKVPPAKPTASANVTAPTNGSVNVTATFAEDSVQNEYSMDGVNWAPYPGLVKFDNNGTVYFRSTDAVGNISEVESYAVTNIDKVPPVKPTASADITTATSGNVTVTAVFSGDSVKKEFSLDSLVWQDYSTPLVFNANGKAYFRGTDAAGNVSDIISYDVTNIQPVTPDNAPDDNRNDWVYNKKTKEWNSAENLASFVVNNITSGDSEIRLDKVGSVEEDGKHNFLGRSGSDEDSADYAKIELSKGAALSFSVDSTAAGTFYVYQATKDKKGNSVTAQRQKISVKANKTSPAKQTTVYLEAGEYFIGMETKLPAAKKGDSEAYYNVKLTATSFFDDADNGWNNSAYKRDDDGKEIKTELNPELVSNAMLFGRGATDIQLDTGAMGKDGYANWTGFSDATDYRMLKLENAANLTLNCTATGKAKLVIWKVSTNAKTGVISLTSKGSVTVKADKTGTVKSKFLEAGTYFVSVTSTDASKGGSAYYNVSVDPSTVFFDSADDGRNDELYNKKAKAFYPEDENHHFEITNVSGAGTNVQLDTEAVKADGYKNFVGYQDKTDYAKIELTDNGNLYFKLKATGNATFTVYRKGQDKKGNDTLEAIQTTKLTLAKGATVVEKFTDVLLGLTAGEYYVSMTAKSTKNNSSGSVFYNVTANLDASIASALEMPETDSSADSLAMTDSLNFGQYDADVLAGTYLDSASDKLFGESGSGLLASL